MAWFVASVGKTFYKIMRTEVGKASNFNYWYSGSLSTVGEKLGWTSDVMWAATDRYRQRFSVAEAWRVAQGEQVSRYGFVQLPDGHLRVRYEATDEWAEQMARKFMNLSASYGMEQFSRLAIKRLQSRAKNQAVNAMIQGTCATLAKRSILAIRKAVAEAGLQDMVRFMLPIHDELVFSVHKDAVMAFLPVLRHGMCNHPDIVRHLPLDCTVAIGRTFMPWDGTPRSQIELDEAPFIEGVIPAEMEGQRLPDHLIQFVIDYIVNNGKIPPKMKVAV